MINPLRKHKLDGKPYRRRFEIEANIVELASLSREELIAQCAIQQKEHLDYVPSECLIYFIRASRADNSDIHFEQLYKILIERVLRCLPRVEGSAGGGTSLLA